MILTTDDNLYENNLDDYQNSSLTFIDTNLTDYQSLIPDINNSNVVFIDSQSNGIEQITETLKNYSNLDSISILSHGDVGKIQLGNAYLSNSNLDNYQNNLAAWGNALSADGDLLLYGCNVGGNQAGLNFVNRVADFTGADVAVSNNLTGNAALGGDWTLEVVTGKVEAITIEVNNYNGVLYYGRSSSYYGSSSNYYGSYSNNSNTYAQSISNSSNNDQTLPTGNSSLKFNLTFDQGTSQYERRAFEMAANMWSNVLNDDATINIHVSMVNNSALPSNTLGGAVPDFVIGNNYSDIRQKLVSDRSTSDDHTAVNSLESSSTWDTVIGDGWMGSSKLALTRANAKALNIIDPHSNDLDGIVVMNKLDGTGLGWNTNYTSNSTGTNQFDFTTVAMHEIGHILGFVTAVDAVTTSNHQDESVLSEAATSLDLFRYIDSGTRDMRLGFADFSIDGGQTNLAKMSWGTVESLGGDGYQASHWKNEYDTGLMDPVAELAGKRSIEELDAKALDVIGWDRVAGSKSLDTLYNEAEQVGFNKANINRNVEVGKMLEDWRWARRGSASTLRQDGNIAHFLAQEGFFSVGAFRESFDFSSVNSAESNNFVVVDNQIKPQEFTSKNDSDLVNDFEIVNNSNVSDVVGENQGIDYEQILALVTEGLSDSELSQLSLEDLAQLIQQDLGEAVV